MQIRCHSERSRIDPVSAGGRFFGRWHACLLLLLSVVAALPAVATPDIYGRAELETEAVRLRNAVIRIYEIGLKPSLTAEEKLAIGDFEFTFPFPKDGGHGSDFAATTDGRFLIMPLAALKGLEDLVTAFAWRYEQRQLLSAIDLYFAMLRYRDRRDFPGGKYPAIMDALAVPHDAYKINKKVDDLSLRLRNEAFAFIIAHELGHIRFKHKPVAQIGALQSQRDETEADRFALDLFARTKTPALGAVVFFQSQIYSLPHRHEYPSEDEWRKHVASVMTHPLSVDRIREMADYMDGPLARSVSNETLHWRDIGSLVRRLVNIMTDDELARCVVRLAKDADPAILRPRGGGEGDGLTMGCWKVPK
jgi:IrrE N-terminal-like domain